MSLSICAAVILGLWLLATPNSKAIPPNPPIIQLTNSHAIDVRPAWSPDNRLIAFQSNRESSTFHIYVMNADGSNPRALTQGSADDRHPVWMPDGKSILFDSSNGNQREIWQVSLADGSLKQITHLGAQANFPSPSPDGQRIAFYVYQGNTLDLWTARIDGSQAKRLTNGLASATNNQCTFACHWAAWSPDSRTIAYSAGELDTIWTMGGDGTDSNQVIANGQDNHFPWFLPDGRLGYITEHVSPIQSWTDAWAYDLQRPDEPYAARGPHPTGVGIDRYRRPTDLTSKEHELLVQAKWLSLLDLVDPAMIGVRWSVPLAPPDWRMTGGLAHQMTSFGQAVTLDLYARGAGASWRAAARLYLSDHLWLPGLELARVRAERTVGGVRLEVTPSLGVWLQPAHDRWDDTSARPGAVARLRIAWLPGAESVGCRDRYRRLGGGAKGEGK